RGVTMLIVAFLGTGITLYVVFERRSLKAAAVILAWAALFGLLTAGSFAAFALTYSTAGVVEDNKPPPPGEPDGALEYHNAFLGLPLDRDAPPASAHPPYLSRL